MLFFSINFKIKGWGSKAKGWGSAMLPPFGENTGVMYPSKRTWRDINYRGIYTGKECGKVIPVHLDLRKRFITLVWND